MSLFILAVLGMAIIGILYNTFRFRSSEWLDQYGNDAEAYAKFVLSGRTSAIPPSLTNHYVETGKHYVSFCIPSGPLESHGMAYSTDGKMPENGLGGEPRVLRWDHVKGNWYVWSAD